MNEEQRELREAVVLWAEKYPDHHEQSDWLFYPGMRRDRRRSKGNIAAHPVSEFRKGACGTTACLAGAGCMLAAPEGSQVVNINEIEPVICEPGDPEGVSVQEYAQAKMGLTDEQADWIFYTMNEKTAIERLRYTITHPEATGEELLGSTHDNYRESD